MTVAEQRLASATEMLNLCLAHDKPISAEMWAGYVKQYEIEVRNERDIKRRDAELRDSLGMAE